MVSPPLQPNLSDFYLSQLRQIDARRFGRGNVFWQRAKGEVRCEGLAGVLSTPASCLLFLWLFEEFQDRAGGDA